LRSGVEHKVIIGHLGCREAPTVPVLQVVNEHKGRNPPNQHVEATIHAAQ